MLNFKRIILTVLVGTFILSSCSIEKRIHRPGYHVEFNKKVKNTSINEALAVEQNTKNSDQVVNQDNIKLNVKEEKNIKLASTSSKEKVSKRSHPELNLKIEEVKSKKNTSTTNQRSTSETKTEEILSAQQTSNDNSLFIENNKQKDSGNTFADTMMILILLLCFFLPPLAVWLMTEDLKLTLISLLLSLLFWLPGVIFALYFFLKKY